jgi:hypothetical protein
MNIKYLLQKIVYKVLEFRWQFMFLLSLVSLSLSQELFYLEKLTSYLSFYWLIHSLHPHYPMITHSHLPPLHYTFENSPNFIN